MPLFKCSKCSVVENTATCNYWTDHLLDGKPALCSQCDPKIARWHELFPRIPAAGMKLGNDGFLYEPELIAKGDFDNMFKAGLKIIGDA